MGSIVWLASYPKSGNTWLRVLLTNYLRNTDEPADINELEHVWIASERILFDQYVGVEASDLTSAEIERYRPFVFDLISAESDKPLFVKIHDALTYSAEGYPLVSQQSTKGVIYLIRNPLDIAISFAHHSNLSINDMIDRLDDRSHVLSAKRRQLNQQLPQKLLTWREHVLSWADEPHLNVVVVRYEDMHTDPIKTFTRIVRFIGLAVDQERIRRAIRFSTFTELERQEQASGFGEKVLSKARFFRKGVIGDWRHTLSRTQVQRIVTAQHDVMRRFGYLDESGEPIY